MASSVPRGERRDTSQKRVNEAVNRDLQAFVRSAFGIAELPQVSEDAHPELIYGKEPDVQELLDVGTRTYGVELYRADPATDRNILVVAQHGYSGSERDWSRLVERLHLIDIPTIMVRGEYDHEDEVSLGVAKEALAGMNGNVLIGESVKGAAHQAHIDQPAKIAALIEQLIQQTG